MSFTRDMMPAWELRAALDASEAELTRLRAEVVRKDAALTILSDHWKHGYGGPTRADVIRAVEDTARAALTAQEKDTQS